MKLAVKRVFRRIFVRSYLEAVSRRNIKIGRLVRDDYPFPSGCNDQLLDYQS